MESKEKSRNVRTSVTDSKCVKEYHLVIVPNVQQCYSWDCGLACVSMVLRALGESPSEVYTKDLDAMECGER
ncbi:guanylyl cyclase domain containing protein GUCD1 [Elysia marginata]|uniref:Guanylyl cyclase domain containing protein GUCD1 n=1 Tax=Elysia marginata TaxID=1093978 RepID=A0AAV4JNI6_9GAST|nr:guanylyl cyclase domain containing protein GUCD1 [Elysia marginata]